MSQEEKTRGKAAQSKSNRTEFRRLRPRKLSWKFAPTTNAENEGATVTREVAEGVPVASKRRPGRCRFFNTKKGCREGDACPFKHAKPKMGRDTVDGEKAAEKTGEEGTVVIEESTVGEGTVPAVIVPPPMASTQRNQNNRVIPKVIMLTKETLGEEEQRKLRESEVVYFKRRFKGTKVVDEGGEEVKDVLGTETPIAVFFSYNITEPEWPFDIKSVQLSVFLRGGHPIAHPSIGVPLNDNPIMPQPLVRHIESELNKEIEMRHNENEKRNAYGAYGKWLIQRVDKRVLKLFIDGLRKTKLIFDAERAGISLVMPTREEKKEESGEDGNEEIREKMEEMEVESSEEEEESEDNEGTEKVERKEHRERPNIQMQITWSDASANIATLEATAITVLLKCARCAEVREETTKVDGTKKAARCSKCGHAQSITVTSSLVHPSSSTLALLSCIGCRPIDFILLRSFLRFVCLSCNRVDDVQNLQFGSVHKSWCRGCHSLIEFTIQSARFHGSFGREEDNEAARSLPKLQRTRETKDRGGGPVEGQPLPSLGTCSHYKKSYRWFRFPCCGRLFPCDTCHEETVKGEHEMKVANRMVCGHCSHEQPFQVSKPCVKCNEATTRKKTQFWEGGKGCRDQKAMSKNDGHKFAGGRMKTVSKKKVGDLVEKKKKTS